jgi:inner membrane protein
MPEFIVQLGPWAWVFAGLILLGLELLAPGNFLIWFGIAAVIVGVLAFATELAWQTELIVFVALAIVAVLIGRRYFSPSREPGEQPFLNQRAARYVGTTHVLADPIVDGQGRVRIDDTNWRIAGPDLPSGASVRIVAADGALLRVEKA